MNAKTTTALVRQLAVLSILFATTTLASAATIDWSAGDATNITANLNWSDTKNWTGLVLPGTSDTVLFDNHGTSSTPGAGSADNIADRDITVAALRFSQTDNDWHNTVINAGVTVTVTDTNNTIMLVSGTQADPPSVTPGVGGNGTTHCFNTISGDGTLVVNSTNVGSYMCVQEGSYTYVGPPTVWATLDMSGLRTFQATVGRLLIGVQGVYPYTAGQAPLFPNSRATGVLYLGQTNVIHLTQTGNIQGTGNAAVAGPALVIGDTYANFSDFSDVMYLGQSNALFADTITIGRNQSYQTSVLEFNPNFTPSQLYLRGASSDRVSQFVVADKTFNGGYGNGNVAANAIPSGNDSVNPAPTTAVLPPPGTPGTWVVGAAGLVDLSGGTSDIMIDKLILGKGYNGALGNPAAWVNGVFNMGAGTLDVNTLQLGVMSSASGNAPVGGTLNVTAGGNVVVNSNHVFLGVKLGTSARAIASGTLNITDGSLNVANGAYGIVDSGQSASAMTLANATITAANIGSASAPIGSITMRDSTLNLTVSGLTGSVVTDKLTTDSSGVGNTINIISISPLAGMQPVITVISSGSEIIYIGNPSDFVLGTLPAGYGGHLQVTASAVHLVLTQSPNTPNNWTGTDLASHQNANWSDVNNWSLGAEPGPGGPAYFLTTGSVASSALSRLGGGPSAIIPAHINSIVDGDVTILALNYANTNGTYQNTFISNSTTLTVGEGGLTVGSPLLDHGNTTGNVTISGGAGTLSVSNSGALIYVGLGHADQASTAQATLDMSGLGAFNASVASFLVGVGSVGPTTILQPVGTVYLAQTNTITAYSGNGASDSSLVALDVGDAGDGETLAGYGNNMGSSLYLGETNAIFADYIAVGRQWASGGIFFNPAFTNANPTVYIRGASGTNAVTSWNIGDGVQNLLTGGGGTGTNDFTGGTIDAVVNTMSIGKSSANSTNGSSAVTGTLTFGAGTINADTLNLSYNNAASDGNVYSYGVGTVNVNGTGTLVVNSTLNMAYTGGAVAGGTPTATLNINGGSVFANNLLAGTNSATSILSINGGSLSATNGIGTASAPLTSLNLTNATIAEGAAAAPFINARNVSAGGSSNMIIMLSLPPIEKYPATLTVLQSATPITGTFNFQTVLPAVTNGPAYAGNASKSADSTAILLRLTSGPIGARGNVHWNGPDPANASMNWSDDNNWILPGLPSTNDTAYFDNTGQSSEAGADSVDNVVDTNITVAALWYAATNASPNYAYHNTVINPAVTLTVFNTNAGIVLDCGTQSDPAGGKTTCRATISGDGGKLVVNDTNSASVIIVSQGSGTYSGAAQLWASLDMSGLDTFQATCGRLLIGVQGVAASPAGMVSLVNAGRQAGIMYLGKTNVIHLTQLGDIQGTGYAAAGGAALVINDLAGFGDFGSFLYLGQSNAMFADTITIGREQCNRTALFSFNPNFTPPSQLYLRGASADRVSEFIVADNTQNGGNGNANPGQGITLPAGYIITTPGSAGKVDLSAGTSDIMIDTLIVGKGHNAAGGGYAAGIFEMGAGTLDVNTLILGAMSSADGNKLVTGTLNAAAGGTVVVNNQLALGQAFGGGTSAFAYGTLNVSGTVSAGAIVSGGNSSITVNGGTINLTSPAGSIGTAAAPIGRIALADSTLNLAVGGPGGAVVTSNLTISGSRDTINVTVLPLIASLPSTVTLIQSLRPISGYDFALGSPLPTGYTGNLQPSSDATAVQLVITKAPLAAKGATITGVSFQEAKSSLVITGTNGLANTVYYVLTSTNVALSLKNWTSIAVNEFDASGSFTITLPYSASDSGRFYVIESQ